MPSDSLQCLRAPRLAQLRTRIPGQSHLRRAYIPHGQGHGSRDRYLYLAHGRPNHHLWQLKQPKTRRSDLWCQLFSFPHTNRPHRADRTAMDLFNKFAQQATSGRKDDEDEQRQDEQKSSGAEGLLGKLSSFTNGGKEDNDKESSGSGNLLDKLHGLAGGGPESEKKEDGLDKGIDWVQEKLLKQGAQDNESAAEQAKDKLIAETIRDQYKKQFGNDFPIRDRD
ncbi:hypothetical protein B0T26DRAFT_700957 [Lasiosphaeria miniovina]|uniref:Uncharacterized protein n=1 Tax=Lasiosphaeria miniovina TaxID=1954250 RepID=A0AA40AU80_9PEZI|nr:uncharacterized protein B0T26DRAFT_700957 [Lasiosphaeria miniovina]KAK0722009.1 hypothetical protein B0T26DRAFT_700957 [Lasiosphaeria miniovina]